MAFSSIPRLDKGYLRGLSLSQTFKRLVAFTYFLLSTKTHAFMLEPMFNDNGVDNPLASLA
jgi:hypothetical protein